MKNRKEKIAGGLSSVLGKMPDITQRDILPIPRIPLDKIKPNKRQPRQYFDAKKMQELADSIAQFDVITPVTLLKVGADTYEILGGERRCRAARMAGLADVPAYVLEDENHKNKLALSLLENLQREDLNPLEIAQSFERLIEEHGYTHEVLAKKMSKDRATVTNFLRLLKLPPFIQVKLAAQKISAGHARALLSLESLPEQQKIALEMILQKTLSVRETERLCKRLQSATATEKAPAAIAKDDTLAQQLTKAWGVPVRVKQHPNNGGGYIQIPYPSQAHLRALLKKWDIDI